jgi:DNA-binding GntR family transcriptional regulator
MLRALETAAAAGYQVNDARSITSFLDANKGFHVAIAETTGNARLSSMIGQLHDQMSRLLHLGLGLRNRSQEMQAEHRALLKALVRGNGDAAERLAREQIEAARGMVLSAVMTSRSVMNLALSGDRA